MYAAAGERPPRPPRVAEWTPERAELTNVVDLIKETNRLLIGLGGRKLPPPGRPQPRPVTGIERFQERLAEEKHRRMVARMLPGRAAPPTNRPDDREGGDDA
jgi:hypothetical protein